jgi:hypothetical protein
MKPDWKDAPKWANYLAMDRDGQWFWYSAKPKKEDDCFTCMLPRDAKARLVHLQGWENSLEKRP